MRIPTFGNAHYSTKPFKPQSQPLLFGGDEVGEDGLTEADRRFLKVHEEEQKKLPLDQFDPTERGRLIREMKAKNRK